MRDGQAVCRLHHAEQALPRDNTFLGQAEAAQLTGLL